MRGAGALRCGSLGVGGAVVSSSGAVIAACGSALLALLICQTTMGCGLVRRVQEPTAVAQAGEGEFVKFISRSGYRFATQPAVTEPVMRVAERVLDAARASAYAARARQVRWDVAVIDAPDVANAFATPGGRIIVFTGLFPVARTEGGLAIVLGHEVAHVLGQHSVKESDLWAQTATLATLAGAVAGIAVAVATKNADAGDAVGRAVGAGTANIAARTVVLPYSREQEMEADRVGVELAARAGYDPLEAVAMMERLVAGTATPSSARPSSHPAVAERRTALRFCASDASLLYRAKAPGAEDPLPDPPRKVPPGGVR